MSDPRIILVILGATATDAADDAIIASAREALGGDAIVLVEPGPPRSDQQALELGNRVHANAVVRVVWADGTKGSAHLDVRVAPSPDWAADDVAFAPSDDLTERGRAVGLAVATMVERLQRAQEDAAPPAPPAMPSPAPPVPPPVVPKPTEQPIAPPPPPRMGFDAFGAGAATVGADAATFGGSVGARFWPVDAFAIRAGASARFGSIPDASARTATLAFDAGVAARIVRVGPVVFEARTSGVVQRLSVTRTYPTVDVSRDRWVLGATAAFEAAWWIAPRTALTAAAGGEVAFGTTNVDVGGTQRAAIEPVRALGELGARIRF